MARERYLLHAGEETIHSNQIELKTPMDKFKNWLHYWYKMILVGVALTALIVAILVSIITKVPADYIFIWFTEEPYPADLVTKTQEILTSVCDDRNGDGKLKVELRNYDVCLPEEFNQQEWETYEAYITKYAVEVAEGDCMIYLYDTPSLPHIYEPQLYCYVKDGTTPAENATDLANMQVNWFDCALLKDIGVNIEVSELFSATYTDEYVHGLLEDTNISFRTFIGGWTEKEKLVAYYNDCWQVFNKMRFGADYTCPPLVEWQGE